MLKHSETKSASITVETKDSKIKVLLQDRGKGFVVNNSANSSKSLGMKTLFERAKILKSKLEIDSQLNTGTTVLLVIPIEKN